MERNDSMLERLRSDNQLQTFEKEREEFRTDPYLPQYHFVPPGGILHDPNGACYWNGRYHLFYQYWPVQQTENVRWDEAMHWGHAVSDDLVHWRDLPIALSPGSGPEASCFSGQALVEDDQVVLMYHGPLSGNCIATSSDPLLETFEKHPENPVIPISEEAPYTIFDPDIWKEGETYYSLSGTHTGGVRGDDCHVIEHLFRSENLRDWEYLGPLVEDEFYIEPGEDGAVPNFFSLGQKHMLLFFSHSRGPQYYVGEYDDDSHRFEIESHGRMNFQSAAYGNLHAPSTLLGPDGRRIAFFNVNAQRETLRTDPTDGWTEVVSLPRAIDIVDEEVVVRPVDEITMLRTDHRHVESVEVPANSNRLFRDLGGSSIEINATINPGDAEEVGISVLRSPSGEEETVISYWPSDDSIGIDTARSTDRSDVLGRPPEVGPLSISDSDSLELRIFVDRSIVEVFANDRQCLTARVFPERSNSVGISSFARRGSALLESMSVWDMESIWR